MLFSQTGTGSEDDRLGFMVGIPRDNVAYGIAWIASLRIGRREGALMGGGS